MLDQDKIQKIKIIKKNEFQVKILKKDNSMSILKNKSID